VLDRRFEIGREFAARVGATVLLKGVPTVIADAHTVLVTATGTPALGTGGSGDVLGGIAAALLGRTRRRDDGGPESATEYAATAAWVHGRAGELATARRGGVRGTTLGDVVDALSDAWPREHPPEPRPCYPVLAELPRVPG
jgi:NAD(P)H-hydrate epimerase